MAVAEIKLEIKVAWWFRLVYLPLLSYFSKYVVQYTNFEVGINEEKFYYWLRKAVTIKHIKGEYIE